MHTQTTVHDGGPSPSRCFNNHEDVANDNMAFNALYLTATS